MEEVHVAAELRARRRVREPRHDDVARVGGNAGACRQVGVELSEDLALDRRQLHHGLDRPRGLRRRPCEIRGRRHAGCSCVGIRTLEPALLDATTEQLTVRGHRSLEMLGVHIDERHVDPVQRRLLRDLRAHGARPDDEETSLGSGRRRRHGIRPRPAT
jgi:hypothetical protein